MLRGTNNKTGARTYNRALRPRHRKSHITADRGTTDSVLKRVKTNHWQTQLRVDDEMSSMMVTDAHTAPFSDYG